MAEYKPSAVARPKQGVRRTTTHSGVNQVRIHQPTQYVVIGNHLAQHAQLSLTAIGLAAHIFSLPDGALVDIRTLSGRFPEGRQRIAAALRELEEHGYLERVRERSETGKIVTRTYAHHVPERLVSPEVRQRPLAVVRERESVARPAASATPEPSQEDDQPAPAPQQSPSRSDAAPTAARVRVDEPGAAVPDEVREEDGDPRREEAVALLAGLRRVDERLILSARDVNALAPGVVRWFERGATADAVRRVLTFDLPADMRRAAGVLAYRLAELLPPPLPAAPAPVASEGTCHRPDPFQTCDGCERAFRAPHPGRCRDCRAGAGSVREASRAA
ncbi:helix-turn-helix domain-containing protein [Streptomyces sp. NPDC006367]|uniref:helix-turn-helix domain-containing protein n=1 Tax=unclassified Streptomyces TaxID=2593676 RepID=UPI0033BCA8A0